MTLCHSSRLTRYSMKDDVDMCTECNRFTINDAWIPHSIYSTVFDLTSNVVYSLSLNITPDNIGFISSMCNGNSPFNRFLSIYFDFNGNNVLSLAKTKNGIALRFLNKNDQVRHIINPMDIVATFAIRLQNRLGKMWTFVSGRATITKGPIMDALVKKIKDGYTFSNFIH